MSHDRLELTKAEAANLVTFVNKAIGACARTEAIVDGIFNRLNQIRKDGDPVGTIRRSADGRIAVRVPNRVPGPNSWSPRSWHYMSGDWPAWRDTANDDCGAAAQIREWEVVYSPGGEE